jgi:hypothetical protein
MTMKKSTLIVYTLVVLIVAIQFIPINRTNPAVKSDLMATDEIKIILKRSCYDCHSNITKWPWYSRIAPVSWLVAVDVKEGRAKMNFSNWDEYDSGRQKLMQEMIWEEIEKNEMPLKLYSLIHRDAVLTENDRDVIKQWAMRERAGD